MQVSPMSNQNDISVPAGLVVASTRPSASALSLSRAERLFKFGPRHKVVLVDMLNSACKLRLSRRKRGT